MMKIKPAEGKAIRDPLTMKLLDPAGEEKPRNSYWIRRLAAGDVIEIGNTGNATDDTDAAPKKRSKSK
ncbi:TPA: DUF2635 domain-containing protein [Escherichia coli]|nr:DUF2635 domain-containing protein [Escherichia coli]